MKHNFLFTVIALFFVVSSVVAQDAKMDIKAFSKDTTVDRGDVKVMKNAEEFYALGEDFYALALPLYLDLHDKPIEYPTLNWRIAVCYLNSDIKAKSLDYLIKCDSTVSHLYYFYLAKSYHFNNDFEKAKENYQFFYDRADEEAIEAVYERFSASSKTYPVELFFQTLIHACELGISSQVDSVDYSFRPLDLLNSSYDELFPVVLSDDVLLYATKNGGADNKSFQIFEASVDSMQRVVSLGVSSRFSEDELDSRIPLPSTFLGVDTFLFQSMLSGGDIMYAYTKNGKVKDDKFPRINSSSKDGTACLLNDTTLVVSSLRADEKGEADLFVSFLVEDKWSKPVLLEGEVNTMGSEEVLCYSYGDLYYISNGKGSIGGYDIFKVAYQGDNNWGVPVNLGYPINTAENDMGFYPIDSLNWIYAGVRPHGIGGSDLFWIEATVVSLFADSLMYADSLTIESMLYVDTLSMDSVIYVDSITMLVDTLEKSFYVLDSLAIIKEMSDSIQAID